MIVPRRNWTRVTDMIDDLHRNFSSAAYVFRNNYFFLDLPTVPHETSNITFLRHRRKVQEHSTLVEVTHMRKAFRVWIVIAYDVPKAFPAVNIGRYM